MKLEDLMSLGAFNATNKLTTRETLVKVLAHELDAYYVFNSNVKITYGAWEANDEGIDEEVRIVTTFSPTTPILLPDNIVRTLWGLEQISLMQLLEAVKPEDYWFVDVEIDCDRPVDDTCLYLKECEAADVSVTNVELPPKQAALKIIGLMMLDLAAEKPKLRIGRKPNKEQIRNHLLELATKHKVETFGLSKSHEGILKQAMTYVPDRLPDE
jgi:hypothetical protein